jgi:hypothetical protein
MKRFMLPWVLASLAALTVMMCVAALTVMHFLAKPAPEVRVPLLVAREQPRILQKQPARMGRDEFANFQRLQLALVRSRQVLNDALRKPEIAELGP